VVKPVSGRLPGLISPILKGSVSFFDMRTPPFWGDA
jgi:hypothetical protein